MTIRTELMLKSLTRWPRKAGKADYIRFLKGERITRDKAIKAKCYECTGGELADGCGVSTCPLTIYYQ